MSFQNRNFNAQQSGNIKPIWGAGGIRQMPIDPLIDGKVSNGSILYWSRTDGYWTVLDKNVKKLTCYGQYLIWDGNNWIIVGDTNVRLGCQSGRYNQGTASVAIGIDAGFSGQGDYSIALGYQAGYTGQGDSSISIGGLAGYDGQVINSIAI